MTLIFTIADDIRIRFPLLAVYTMRVRGLATAISGLDTSTLLRNAATSLDIHEGAITQHPLLAAWRHAYAALGVKPSKYRSSIEALLRRAVKGSPLETGIGAVDLYNACSLEACAPLGAYDVARLPPQPLTLRLARPGADQFEPLGAEASAFPLTESLAVYAAGETVLCWGFNVRDSNSAALTATTEDAIFFSEAVDPDQARQSEAAMKQLRNHLLTVGVDCAPIQTATPVSPNVKID